MSSTPKGVGTLVRTPYGRKQNVKIPPNVIGVTCNDDSLEGV